MPDTVKERKSYATKNRLVILDYLKENCSTTISAADIKKHLEEKEISVNTVRSFLRRNLKRIPVTEKTEQDAIL